MNRVRVGIAVAALVVAAGCGSGSGNESKAPQKAAPASASPSAEVPRISESTFCRIVFNGDDNPLADATGYVQEFVKNPDPTQMDAAKLKETKAALESLALRSPESLAPHVLAEAETMQTLIDAHNHPVNGQEVDFETFRSSGLEIATTCGG